MDIFGVTFSGDDFLTLAVFSGVALLMWILAAFWGSRVMKVRRKAAEGAAWPGTQGVVLFSQVLQHRSSDSSGGYSYSYSAQVNYQYTVAGQSYQGDKLDFSQLGMGGWRVAGGYKQAQTTAAQFPMGKTVPVYYNPQNPAEAVLQKKSSGTTVMLIGVIILVLIGCGMFVGQFFILLR